MKSNGLLSFFLLLFLSLQSCSEESAKGIDVYLDVSNPRNLGKATYYLMSNGKIIGESNEPIPSAIKKYDYEIGLNISAYSESGKLIRPNIYLANKSGSDESIIYNEIDQPSEIKLSPSTCVRIKSAPELKRYIFAIHSDLERTGVRVLRVSSDQLASITELNALKVPDLMTLPLLDEDPEKSAIDSLNKK